MEIAVWVIIGAIVGAVVIVVTDYVITECFDRSLYYAYA